MGALCPCPSSTRSQTVFVPRLAEKKASIGYTYEDSTVAELENSLEKRGDEEDSEEDSNTDEDEVIPDIGVSCLPRQSCLGILPVQAVLG